MSTPSSIVGEQKRAGKGTPGSPTWRITSFCRCQTLLILLTPTESPFPPLSPLLIDLGGMLTAFLAEQKPGSIHQRVGERSVQADKIPVRGAAVGSSLALEQAKRIGCESPAIDVEARADLPDDFVRSSRLQQGLDNFRVGRGVEPLSPNSLMPELAGQPASRAASHYQRLSLDASLRPCRGIDDQSGRKPRAFLRRYRPRLAKPLP